MSRRRITEDRVYMDFGRVAMPKELADKLMAAEEGGKSRAGIVRNALSEYLGGETPVFGEEEF